MYKKSLQNMETAVYSEKNKYFEVATNRDYYTIFNISLRSSKLAVERVKNGKELTISENYPEWMNNLVKVLEK